jgi:hypothetical protein
MKKTICILFMCAAVATMATAQKKYDEVFNYIRTLKDPEAFQILFAHQAATTSRDFMNVNGYYILGVLSQQMMHTYDPFLQAGNVQQYIRNAKTYFGVAAHYITEKDVKKNAKYYAPYINGNIDDISFEAIKADIAAREKDVETYGVYFAQNERYINEGIRKYNTCIDFFRRINEQNSRLYDLYFLADNDLLNNLGELEENFNAVIGYLDSLKASLEAYDMKGYRINYVLEPVQIHRLHGLTPANFLAKRAEVWDYAAWVKDFRTMLATDVAFLYKETAAINDTANRYIKNLAGGSRNDVPAEFALNPLVINKIYRYDYNTAVAPLLKYQEWKVRFLYHTLANEWQRGLFAPNDFAPQSNYYFDLVTKKITADSMLALTRRNTSPAAIAKYRTFFDKYYGGYEGLKQYLEKEQAQEESALQTALKDYKDAVVQTLYSPDAGRSIVYKGEPFYTNIVPPYGNFATGYYIHHKTILSNGKALVAGVAVTAAGQKAFAAVVGTSEEVEWLQTLGDAAETAMLTDISGLDYIVLTHNRTTGGNRLYLLDFKGNTKKTADLTATGMPRHCIYNDISQNYALTFSNGWFQTSRPTQDSITLLMLSADFAPQWTAALPQRGYFVNTIRTNDKFYVYTAAPKNGKMQTQVNVVTSDGAITEQAGFAAAFPYYPVRIAKINSDYADMIAVKDTPDGEEAFYMVIGTDNKSVYSSGN